MEQKNVYRSRKMAKHTVLVLQDGEQTYKEIEKAISEMNDYEIVGYTSDGEKGIDLLEKLTPEILITDLILKNVDGFAVMDKIVKNNLSTKILVTCAFMQESIISKAIEHGASYYLVKPISQAVLKERLEDLTSVTTYSQKEDYVLTVKPAKSNLDEKISKIFISVGIPPHIKGYSYLREGVKIAVKEPDIINNITKKLYPMIGERYSTSASKVERAIRHAIEVAWNKGRIDSINNIFGVRAYIGSEKPTNGEFIALIADKMLLEGA